MEREELDELVDCSDCGTTVSPSEDAVFLLDDERVLCFECALRRGGSYDADTECWVLTPDTNDLPDERRPHP
jgi:hypothetical protein